MLDETPRWIAGGQFEDVRGSLSFVNDFDLSSFVRLYSIQTNASRSIRAWQGHKHEQKAFYCVAGEVSIAVVKVDDWEHPSLELTPLVFSLNEKRPGILFIPGGYANGIKPLTDFVHLFVFSDKTLEQSQQDDIRFHPNQWNSWQNK